MREEDRGSKHVQNAPFTHELKVELQGSKPKIGKSIVAGGQRVGSFSDRRSNTAHQSVEYESKIRAS